MNSCYENMTVILPCAGDGKRMNIDYPKELYEIFPGVKLIDLSIEHIQFFLKKKCAGLRVAVVIREGKEQVFDYVENRLGKRLVIPVQFNDNYREWPGSVFSAREYYSEINVVLLPDSFVSAGKNNIFINEKGKGILEQMQESLRENEVVFGIKECSAKDTLRVMGAVSVTGGAITEFSDKPDISLEKYNAFWGVYGFRNTVSEEFYSFLIRNVEKKDVNLKDMSFYPPGHFFLAEYFDLGTPENIEKFKNSDQFFLTSFRSRADLR